MEAQDNLQQFIQDRRINIADLSKAVKEQDGESAAQRRERQRQLAIRKRVSSTHQDQKGLCYHNWPLNPSLLYRNWRAPLWKPRTTSTHTCRRTTHSWSKCMRDASPSAPRSLMSLTSPCRRVFVSATVSTSLTTGTPVSVRRAVVLPSRPTGDSLRSSRARSTSSEIIRPL